ncbi:MAG TPA: flavodoxin domain-containing protein [Virgibacillus sp.]|nr:flavodoxin domain-containing protein [Virgibacillus sp.]
MGRILVLYASMTGNTELMADAIINYIEEQGYEVETRTFDFDPVEVDELSDYEAIAIGTHTWDGGDLPYEVEDFYEELDDVDIEGMLFGVFGSADSFYDTYGGAVDLMWEHLSDKGARMVPEKIKADLTPNADDIDRCIHFAQTLCDMAKVDKFAEKDNEV